MDLKILSSKLVISKLNYRQMVVIFRGKFSDLKQWGLKEIFNLIFTFGKFVPQTKGKSWCSTWHPTLNVTLLIGP